MSADPDLLALWTRGWALTRGVPPPHRDGSAWRIDVGQPDQVVRYVYAGASETVRMRAETLTTPWSFLKVCAEDAVVRPLLPPRWSMRPPGFMMTLTGTMGRGADPPAGLRLETEAEGPVIFCRLIDPGNQPVAWGRAVIVDGVVVFDRIATAPHWRRRGLASCVMRRLQERMRDRGGADGVLVATVEGRSLYERLGWSLHTPYATAVLPGLEAA